MIASVRELANVGAAAAEPAERLWAFAVRLRRQHARRAAEAVALRTALLATGPAVAAAWWWPALRLPVLLALVLLVLAAAVVAALRARSVADAALLCGDEPGAGLEPFGDELATWLELHRRRRGDTPMGRWLSSDVDARLPRLPAKALRQVGRRRLGRWRRLLPVVLLLVLAWLIAQWLAPPWLGVGGGGGGGAGSTGAGGGAGGGSGAPDEGRGTDGEPDPERPDDGESPPPEPQPPEAQPPQPPPAAPPPPTGETPPTPEPEAPAPLLDLPEQQRFVVPEFLGDGPSRRVRMHAAELAQGGGAPRTPTATAPTGDGSAPAAPPPTSAQFERAAEAAQRARHVPDEERPIVRRFFELLREAAK